MGRGRKHLMLHIKQNLFVQKTSKTPFEIYYQRKPNVSYFRVFGCKCFVLNTKDNLGKFDAKSYEAIFAGYSNTSKAYRVFNRSALTIEKSMHVKFEESNVSCEECYKIDFLDENMEKISLKDSPMQEDKTKDDGHGEVQDVEVEQTQPLSKNWRYATSHPKDLIIGDVSKGVTTGSKLHDIYGNFAFISHIEPKNVLEAEGDSYWLLAMQEELN